VTLETVLVLGAALFAVGLYGAMAMDSVVMILMGLELIVNGVIVSVVGFWYYLSPQQPDGQIFAMIAMLVMAIEAAMGFAVAIAIFRAGEVEMVDSAKELSG
jgi:NAD(P)H-quinone oxidoreductase subunit 4L